MAVDGLFLGYVLVFGAAAIACIASAGRARRIDDPDTRRGVVWLLLLSGAWAAAHVGFLLAPSPALKTAFYMLGLVVGFATVGPWLYFCSAFTGRSLHRNVTIRHTAIAVFLAIVLVKLTNPLHGYYFTTRAVATPFPHLAVETGLFHWLVMGLSYALALVGYFMLLELFMQISYDTKPFVALLGVTGLPIVLDVLGYESTYLVDITYEPLGVAIFAVGFSYVYLDHFRLIQLAAGHDEPVVLLNEDDRIRDYNESAAQLFPVLRLPETTGEPLAAVLPVVDDSLADGTEIVEMERDGNTRYFRLTENPFGVDQGQLGRLITLTDVTHREQYRRELERQNERLDQFANMVSHDLRNPLNVATSRLELARAAGDNEHLTAIAGAHGRMEALIDDLLTLARQGQPIDETERVELRSLVEACWDLVETGDAELVVDGDLVLQADSDRLQQLLENLFRNAIEHGGDDLTIRVGPLDDAAGFYVEDDGRGIPEDVREHVFESGFTTNESGTGFGLAIVQEIADAHDWSIAVTESEAGVPASEASGGSEDDQKSSSGGARFEVSGVQIER
ncbi:ATP-binding protein [Halorientalis halophila]|uniref:ATP-binding protein n=1 Tax=Halorientalis halophila TaxID=3108499 RepID=UPI0030098694